MTKLVILLFAFFGIFPAAIAFLLLLIHRTHFIVEYANLLRIGKLFKAEGYFHWLQANRNQSYPVFLDETGSNFFTRLLRCPWCLSTWIAAVLNSFVIFGLYGYVGFAWASLIGWLWSFYAGYISVFLYFLLTLIYFQIYPEEKPN